MMPIRWVLLLRRARSQYRPRSRIGGRGVTPNLRNDVLESGIFHYSIQQRQANLTNRRDSEFMQ
jgi:hypothetical protein